MKKSVDILYLFFRILIATSNKIIFYLFRLFPINNKKIIFCSIEGQCGYSCNPRYVAEEIIKRDWECELVWLVNDLNKQFPKEIRKVKNTLWNRIYHLSTAKVWIDNSRKPYGTIKRKKQIYIQVWHATLAFKPAGKRRTHFPKIAYLISKNDSRMADYILTNSEWCDLHYPDLLLTCKNTLRIGSPRCDILINCKEEMKKRVRQQYRFMDDAKIVMYAPTFRGGSQQNVRRIFAEDVSIDLKCIQKVLERRFGGNWYVFMRIHPQLAAMHTYPVNQPEAGIYDVSHVDDMNFLLAGMDAFITDYSSAAFDASYIKMPVFIYAEDIEDYTKDRGSLLWDMYTLPFPVAKNNDELEHQILHFEEDKYINELNKFFETVGLLEDGQASERVVNIIEKYIETGVEG